MDLTNTYNIYEALIKTDATLIIKVTDVWMILVLLIMVISAEIVIIRLLKRTTKTDTNNERKAGLYISNIIFLAVSPIIFVIILCILELIINHFITLIQIISVISAFIVIKELLFSIFLKKPEGKNEVNWRNKN